MLSKDSLRTINTTHNDHGNCLKIVGCSSCKKLLFSCSIAVRNQPNGCNLANCQRGHLAILQGYRSLKGTWNLKNATIIKKYCFIKSKFLNYKTHRDSSKNQSTNFNRRMKSCRRKVFCSLKQWCNQANI